MAKKLIAATMILLVLIVGVSGCTIDKVSNEQEASDKVLEVSETMDDISGTLEEVDSDLG